MKAVPPPQRREALFYMQENPPPFPPFDGCKPTGPIWFYIIMRQYNSREQQRLWAERRIIIGRWADRDRCRGSAVSRPGVVLVALPLGRVALLPGRVGPPLQHVE